MNGTQFPLIPHGTPFRADLPNYPLLMQAVRVTGGTVPGPSGYASSSALGPSLYIGYTQQLDPSTLLPRDREPCFVLDLNRYGLTPGYYTNARLAGSYQSLPVYEVGSAPVSPLSFASFGPSPLGGSGTGGLTQSQIISLNTLSPSQIQVLNNLNPCQLTTLLSSIPISEIHTLTNTLTPTQLTNLINFTTHDQFESLYNQLTTSQIINLTTNFNQEQIWTLISVLTPAQIQELLTILTTTELTYLTTLYPAELEYLLDLITISELDTFLDNIAIVDPDYLDLLFSLPITDLVQIIQYLAPSDITSIFNNLTLDQIAILLSLPVQSIIAIIDNLTPEEATTIITTTPLPTVMHGITIVPNTPSTPTTPPDGYYGLYVDNGTLTLIDDTGTETPVGGGGGGGTEASVAATGSVQGDAAAITANHTAVTGADGTKGVILTDGTAKEYFIWNSNSSNGLKVYPPSGAKIAASATDAADFLNATGTRLYFRLDSTHWGYINGNPATV